MVMHIMLIQVLQTFVVIQPTMVGGVRMHFFNKCEIDTIQLGNPSTKHTSTMGLILSLPKPSHLTDEQPDDVVTHRFSWCDFSALVALCCTRTINSKYLQIKSWNNVLSKTPPR
jgi:hypothetical protein